MYSSGKPHMLGILGGLGPMSTAYFYELITSMTSADTDQEHIDMVISSRATTPDRTAFILGCSDENPLDYMIEDAKRLIAYGADILAIPCNTAHYFYDRLSENINVPVLNIIFETVSFLKRNGVKKAGILATDGTIFSNTYQLMCNKLGLGYMIPSPRAQQMLTDIIYGSVKCGEKADIKAFESVVAELSLGGCDRVILGCTELSLIKRSENLGDYYADSLEILAHSSILACGKRIKEGKAEFNPFSSIK